jgi:hypothetical protein
MSAASGIRPTTTVRAKRDQLSTELGGEAVVLDLGSGVYYGLNETGARIWSLIAEPISVFEICHTLESEYEVDGATCAVAVTALIDALHRAGLIEVSDEP